MCLSGAKNLAPSLASGYRFLLDATVTYGKAVFQSFAEQVVTSHPRIFTR